MDTETRLRGIVAPLCGLEIDKLSAGTQLRGRLTNSIGRATLDSSVRRAFGIICPAVYHAATYGDLESAIQKCLGQGATESSDDRVEPVVASSGFLGFESGSSSGIDIEEIDSLPIAADYWSEQFYLSHFSPHEIAYCVRQEEPRMHFAARWCVKEALRKCDSSFLRTPFSELAVVEYEGKPHLEHHQQGQKIVLPHSVSLSHTGRMAIGIVVLFSKEVGPKIASPTPNDSTSSTHERSPRSVSRFVLATSMTFLGGVVAMAAWLLLVKK